MDGIIIINKPQGCTSHDIVYKVKKILGEKVGHTGTLDPNATGVLPLLIGKGTLVSKYLINHDKTYEVVLKLGKQTDTADIEGKVIEIKEVDNKILDKENIEKVLKSFVGKQEQTPPIYSAIKVQGKKLYEYARNGEDVKIKPRSIEIYSMGLKSIDKESKEIIFKVACSKGTYVRTLCEDIAKKLGTIGYMKELNRTKVGNFNIEDSVTIEEIEKNYSSPDLINKYLISVEKLFADYPKVILNEKLLRMFLNGVRIHYKTKDGIYRIYSQNSSFIGIAILEHSHLKRDVII